MSTEFIIPAELLGQLFDSEEFREPVPDPDDHFDVLFSAGDDAPDDEDEPVPFVAAPALHIVQAGAAQTQTPFPGAGAFKLGQSNPAVTLLGELLIKRGGKRFYQVGAGPVFGTADRNACAAFQRAQGWTDKNADGYPGPVTWQLLVSGAGHDIPAAGTTLASPVPGFKATFAFGVKDKRYAAGFHTGRDYAAPSGTPIVAVVSGKVIRDDNGGAYGKWTQILGDDGHVWMYAHQSKRAVHDGDRVAAGQVIGYVGATGNVTGPHLHLEKSRHDHWAYADVVEPNWLD